MPSKCFGDMTCGKVGQLADQQHQQNLISRLAKPDDKVIQWGVPVNSDTSASLVDEAYPVRPLVDSKYFIGIIVRDASVEARDASSGIPEGFAEGDEARVMTSGTMWVNTRQAKVRLDREVHWDGFNYNDGGAGQPLATATWVKNCAGTDNLAMIRLEPIMHPARY